MVHHVTSMTPGSDNPIYGLEPGVAPDGGALWTCSGAREYSTVANRWRRTMEEELFECEQRVTRCSRTVGELTVVPAQLMQQL
jgi:hypothetical protein